MSKEKETKMPDLSYSSTPRYICTVLDEMRTSIKGLHIHLLSPLIEEAQHLANRMEAALEHHKDIPRLEQDIVKLKDARRALKREVKKLIDKRDGLKKGVR